LQVAEAFLEVIILQQAEAEQADFAQQLVLVDFQAVEDL
jgi:hypothetical protein